MRSKEVEEAIEILKHTGHEDDFTWFVYALGNVTGDSIDNATEILLSYIETLEKLPNKIRDKIKELEERDKKYKTYTRDGRENFTVEYLSIPILKSLLGE